MTPILESFWIGGGWHANLILKKPENQGLIPVKVHSLSPLLDGDTVRIKNNYYYLLVS